MTGSGAAGLAVWATELPRSVAVTDALLAPAPPLTQGGVVRWRQSFVDALRTAVGAPPGDDRIVLPRPVRIRGYSLHPSKAAATGFCWTPRTARRSVGMAAWRGLRTGAADTPAVAVEQAVAVAANTGGGGWEDWVGGLTAGARAVVRAEATSWLTEVVGALDWERLGPGVEVGGPDRWWDVPGVGGLGLRGRAEVRARCPADRGHRPALFCLLSGPAGPSRRNELVLPALVDVMRRPGAPVAARVVGWWPESGRCQVVPIDDPALRSAARAVVDAVRRAGGAGGGR